MSESNTVIVEETGVRVVTVGVPGPSGETVTPRFPYVDFIQDAAPAMIPGRTAWDETDKTLKTMLSADVILQHGQENHIYVRNAQGSIITNGQIVYIFGATGQTPTVKLADAADYDKASAVIGMATQDLAINGFGYVTSFGIVRSVDTADFTEGALLYLSATPGEITDTAPAHPNTVVVIGVCLYCNGSNGKVFFSPRVLFHSFGDIPGGDYSEFLDNGSLRFVGDARAWRDETGDALTLRMQGTGLSTNLTELTADFTTGADLNDYLYKNVQLNHDRDLTEVLYPHIHFFQNQNAVPNFVMYYRYQNNLGAKTTAWTPIRCNVPAVAYVSGTIHQIAHTPAGITPPAGSEVSDIIQFKIHRDNANASAQFTGTDPFSGTVGVLSFDVHIHLDSVGSDTQYGK